MKGLVIGMGEVGAAHYAILKRVYPETEAYDIKGDYRLPSKDEPFDIIHVAINYAAMDHATFVQTVRDYVTLCAPKVVNILSTVRPGTCEEIGGNIVHSTTRGLHPDLVSGILAIPKHIGGPGAEKVAHYFRRAGIQCITHKLARTTEVAHILNNAAYGVNLILADEMSRLCRFYGVDYTQAVTLYTMTNNAGYRALDHESKCRMVLTPPNGRIGGHCVSMSAGLIDPKARETLMDLLANYNETREKNPGKTN